MDLRQMYWKKMCRYKYQLYYLTYFYKQSIIVNRVIKIIIAVASCSAICIWATFQPLSFICGGIIAFSQLVSAIYEFLPYQKRISALSNMIDNLTLLYNEVEMKWRELESGNISDSEIQKLINSFDNRWDTIKNHGLTEDVLPHNEKFKKKAEEETDTYYRVLLGGVRDETL